MKVYVAVKYDEICDCEIKIFRDLNDVIKQIHIWAGEDFIGSFQHSEDNRDMQFEIELIKEKIRTSWVEYENGLIKFISWGAEGRKTDCWWDLVDIE